MSIELTIIYLQECQVLRQKFIKFFGDENTPYVKLQERLVAVIILIKVMRSLRWNKQDCLEFNITLGIKMSPR